MLYDGTRNDCDHEYLMQLGMEAEENFLASFLSLGYERADDVTSFEECVSLGKKAIYRTETLSLADALAIDFWICFGGDVLDVAIPLQLTTAVSNEIRELRRTKCDKVGVAFLFKERGFLTQASQDLELAGELESSLLKIAQTFVESNQRRPALREADESGSTFSFFINTCRIDRVVMIRMIGQNPEILFLGAGFWKDVRARHKGVLHPGLIRNIMRGHGLY